MAQKKSIDDRNREYWNVLCGSSLARMLGVNDFSFASFAKFDAYYLSYYSYLLEHVPLHALWGKRVLEIGLGYGTLAQQLAAACDYTGLDIAPGPVAVTNQRLAMHGLSGTALEGSILDPPFERSSFDAVVTIGCLHHTGDLPRALAMIRRILVPKGSLMFMVYNAYSYRRWLTFFGPTSKFLFHEYFGFRQPVSTAEERGAYDGGEGGPAPETEFFSVRQLKRLLKGFEQIRVTRENACPESVFKYWNREGMRRFISPRFGLDLYVSAKRTVD